METKNILRLAKEQGLLLSKDFKFNEMGIDFRVCFATDLDGKEWVLRIPRRKNLANQIELEKRILELVKRKLSVEVPNWEIVNSDLIAYPLLKNKPALTFDSETYQIVWNMDANSPEYISSLAKTLVELHKVSESEALENKLEILNADDLRLEIQKKLDVVSRELGISDVLHRRYERWLSNDSLWPSFTSFVHGDLYAGHILTTKSGVVSGIIDWSTAKISDPSIDFSGHVSVFGEESLKELIAQYKKMGGKVWDRLFEQTIERAAAAPLVYGFFALESQDETHVLRAKEQLGLKK